MAGRPLRPLHAFKWPKNLLRLQWDDPPSVHRLVVRMAAFQAVDMGSNPVERNSRKRENIFIRVRSLLLL